MSEGAALTFRLLESAVNLEKAWSAPIDAPGAIRAQGDATTAFRRAVRAFMAKVPDIDVLRPPCLVREGGGCACILRALHDGIDHVFREEDLGPVRHVEPQGKIVFKDVARSLTGRAGPGVAVNPPLSTTGEP